MLLTYPSLVVNLHLGNSKESILRFAHSYATMSKSVHASTSLITRRRSPISLNIAVDLYDYSWRVLPLMISLPSIGTTSRMISSSTLMLNEMIKCTRNLIYNPIPEIIGGNLA